MLAENKQLLAFKGKKPYLIKWEDVPFRPTSALDAATKPRQNAI